MSRYASARDGERRLHPGRFTGWFNTLVIDPEVLARTYDPEGMRRHVQEKARHLAVQGYNNARRESLEGPSTRWMRPHGRPRYRWVTRDFGGHTVLEVTVAVYPINALDRHTQGVPA